MTNLIGRRVLDESGCISVFVSDQGPPKRFIEHVRIWTVCIGLLPVFMWQCDYGRSQSSVVCCPAALTRPMIRPIISRQFDPIRQFFYILVDINLDPFRWASGTRVRLWVFDLASDSGPNEACHP